jgi:protein-tyrosine phosphatase
MAAVLLGAALRDRGVKNVRVLSAGVLAAGAPAAERAQDVVPGLDEHISRQLTSSVVHDADLIVCMERSHVREVTVLNPGAFARTFTLKELVRIAPPRASDESIRAWVRSMGAERVPSQYLGDNDKDDLADPMGGPHRAFEDTAAELRLLIESFVDLAWPRATAVVG